jgi:hypothetical protein
MSKTERAEPKFNEAHSDKEDPTLDLDLSDNVLPRLEKSNTDRADPRRP